MFDPHIQSITKIEWDERNQILYTGSKDKSVKAWRIPNEWNVYYEKKEEKMEQVKIKEVKPKENVGSDEESDDDDLKGWANK